MAMEPIDRRDFLRAAGLTFLATLLPSEGFALTRADAVYATSCRLPDGRFAIATVTEDGRIVAREPLPGRAHGLAVSEATGLSVFFARRPGTFAMAYDPLGRQEPVCFSSPADRHFYGHGTFSPDGRLLYATENDFEGARGIVGVYDATAGFRRIGEFPSFGIGPHDMAFLDGGRTLIVANGGIETHPDFGRTKLNLGSMKPSLAFIDSASGTLIEKHALPARLSRLSTRHVAEDGRGTIWFGCQYEGAETDEPPVLGRLSLGEEIRFLPSAGSGLQRLRNYVGAIAVNRGMNIVAATSPVGGSAVIVDIATEKVLRVIDLPDACGIAPARDGMVVSSYTGTIAGRQHDGMAWDQHIADLARKM